MLLSVIEIDSVILKGVVWNLGIMITKVMMQSMKQHNNCENINFH